MYFLQYRLLSHNIHKYAHFKGVKMFHASINVINKKKQKRRNEEEGGKCGKNISSDCTKITRNATKYYPKKIINIFFFSSSGENEKSFFFQLMKIIFL